MRAFLMTVVKSLEDAGFDFETFHDGWSVMAFGYCGGEDPEPFLEFCGRPRA